MCLTTDRDCPYTMFNVGLHRSRECAPGRSTHSAAVGLYRSVTVNGISMFTALIQSQRLKATCTRLSRSQEHYFIRARASAFYPYIMYILYMLYWQYYGRTLPLGDTTHTNTCNTIPEYKSTYSIMLIGQPKVSHQYHIYCIVSKLKLLWPQPELVFILRINCCQSVRPCRLQLLTDHQPRGHIPGRSCLQHGNPLPGQPPDDWGRQH